MKLGILTFHSQLNYGGVLQCWALKTALEKMGHEVVVIDRWLDRENGMLNRGYAPLVGKGKIRYWFYSLMRIGDVAWRRRVIRTQRFVESRINKTSFHFYQWEDLRKGDVSQYDALIVGSDQVWHCGDWGDPRVYLLEGFNDNQVVSARRIMSYAASFGLRNLPDRLSVKNEELGAIEAEPLFKRGLARFDAISCREREGCEICERLGFAATHVVDPTQLLVSSDWSSIATIKRKRLLTCYFLSENVDAAMPTLRIFARRQNCEVRILVYDSPRYYDWLPTPRSPRTIYRWLRGVVKRVVRRRVRVLEDAGPEEFVRAHAEAEWVVTDSFHSLMFATTFGKNVRVLRPKSEMRRKMFARMEEYAAHADGPLIADNLEEALVSFVADGHVAINGTWLSRRREDSMRFLNEQLSCLPVRENTDHE